MGETEAVYRQIAELAERYGARRVRLFGSRARGTNRETSDIDIAVEGCADFNGFYDAVQEDLWSLLEVDVVNLDGPVDAALAGEIERDGKVLYEA